MKSALTLLPIDTVEQLVAAATLPASAWSSGARITARMSSAESWDQVSFDPDDDTLGLRRPCPLGRIGPPAPGLGHRHGSQVAVSAARSTGPRGPASLVGMTPTTRDQVRR
jgi:hypothetical protein